MWIFFIQGRSILVSAHRVLMKAVNLYQLYILASIPVLPISQPNIPDSKVYGANMGPTWVLSAPAGSHFGPMNLAIRDNVIKRQINKTITDISILLRLDRLKIR